MIPSKDMWNTKVRAWVWTKIFSNGWHQPFSRLNIWIEKFTQLKKHTSYRKSRGEPGRMTERSKAPDSRNSSVENSGTRVCAWVRIPILSENVLNTMRQSLQLTNSLSYWNVNSRWQSKAKENKRLATSLGGWRPSSLKKHKKEDTQQRHVKHESTRVGLNENLFEWMKRTV